MKASISDLLKPQNCGLSWSEIAGKPSISVEDLPPFGGSYTKSGNSRFLMRSKLTPFGGRSEKNADSSFSMANAFFLMEIGSAKNQGGAQ
jgi:hypothetical protein